MRLGVLGAFSIDNAGDALIGLAVRQALARHLPGADVSLFSPRLPDPLWRHEWSSARGLGAAIEPVATRGKLEWARRLDALVIGGGGFVRPDPDFDAFLLGEPVSWRELGVPAAWNAVCAAGVEDPDPAWRARVRACCEALSYVSVRNLATAKVLEACGFAGEVSVVPDCAMSLEVPHDPELDRVIERAGADPSRPLIGVSVGKAVDDKRASRFYERLFARLARPLEAEVLVLPWGNVYRDRERMHLVSRVVPRARVVREPLDPLGLWRLVGRLSLHVATRFHAAVAALAQDVPFLVLDEARSRPESTSKHRELIVENGLEEHYLCPFLDTDPAAAFDRVWTRARETSFAPKLARLRARLDDHYRVLVERLTCSGRASTARGTGGGDP